MIARLVSLARSLLLAAGAVLLLVTFTPIVPWTAARLTERWTDSDGDVLIVLTGSTVEMPAAAEAPLIGADSYWRAIYAAAAWRQGHFRKMLVCGSGSLKAIKPFLVFLGVPENAVLTEDRSRSTRENAIFAKPLLAGLTGKLVLLTSDYHMFRASRCFAREGVPVVTRPIPDLLKACNSLGYRWQGFLTVSGEILKIAYYKARGWI
jgi:uncharacterized SAM-binding protein YcdF (DUF218 family)